STASLFWFGGWLLMGRVKSGGVGAFVLFCGLCLGIASVAWAEAKPPPTLITMNFQNVDIPVLAKFISELTGKNFLIDESVRGKVTITSPNKVSGEQAYQIFQSVLQLKGFTTEQAGKIIKIIPARNVRQSAPITDSEQPFEQTGDQYVTRL